MRGVCLFVGMHDIKAVNAGEENWLTFPDPVSSDKLAGLLLSDGDQLLTA